MSTYDKNNKRVKTFKFFSRDCRKTPVVILIAILFGFTVLGWIHAYQTVRDAAVKNYEIVNVVTPQKLTK